MHGCILGPKENLGQREMAAGGLVCRACVETSLGTRMLVMAPMSSSIAGFKERIKLLHAHSFPHEGEVVVGELMVFLYGFWYTISGDGTLGVALGGADRVKAHVDVVPVVPVVPVARVSRRKRKEREEDMLEVLKEIRNIFTTGIVVGGGGAPLTQQQQPKGAVVTQPSSLAAAPNKAAAAVVEEAPNLDSVEEALKVDGADEDAVEDAIDATEEAVTVLPAKVAVAVPGATQPLSVVVEEAPVVDAATQQMASGLVESTIQAATVVDVEAEAEADPTQIVLTQKEADADPTQIVLTQKDPAVQPSVGKEASSSAQAVATSKAFAMACDSEILSPDQFVAKMIKARGGKAKKKNEATRTAFKVRKLVI